MGLAVLAGGRRQAAVALVRAVSGETTMRALDPECFVEPVLRVVLDGLSSVHDPDTAPQA